MTNETIKNLTNNQRRQYLAEAIEQLQRDEGKARSHWGRAVIADAWTMGTEYAEEVSRCAEIIPLDYYAFNKALLNGAEDWSGYSWSGCALIYNGDIAKRYCTPSELKKTDNGNRRPNAREEWLDVQARALYQAARKLWREFVDVCEWHAAQYK